MMHNRNLDHSAVLNKVPQVTFAFWVIKICATSLGETGGDALPMSLNRLRDQHWHFPRHLRGDLRGANCRVETSSLSLLVGHRRDHDLRLSEAHRRSRLSVAKMIIGG
jgi:hypothetical protein